LLILLLVNYLDVLQCGGSAEDVHCGLDELELKQFLEIRAKHVHHYQTAVKVAPHLVQQQSASVLNHF
jgi:hypothetical protein